MEYFKGFGITAGQGKFGEEAFYGTALVYNLLNNEISLCLQEFNLTPAKFNVLMTIKHQGGAKGISQVEISDRLIVTASNMTRLLDKLEDEGLVYREALEGDRRVNVIKVSPKGSKILDQVWPGYNKKIQELTQKLENKDQKALAQILTKWMDKLIQE